MKPDFGITAELLALVKHEEGWVPHPYLCPAGKPTIGYGHRIPSLDHPTITEEQGEEILATDLVRYRNNALALSPVLATEPELRCSAITDFCFNAGAANYGTSTLRKRVNEKNWKAAAAEMKKWVHATDPKTGAKFVLAGLVHRRTITAEWLERV